MFFDNVLDEADDLQRLRVFLNNMENLFGFLLEGPTDPDNQPLIVDELLGPLRDAFAPVHDHIGNMHQLLAEPGEGILANLEEHGLTGPQLHAKLAVTKYHDNRLNQGGPVGYILRKVIEAVDVVLDSLIEAIGAGGAVAEFKKALGLSLDND